MTKSTLQMCLSSYIMQGMKTTYIYMLLDPRTDLVRYVGKTIQSPEKRLNAHMNERSNCHRVHWLQELRRVGLVPELVILEEIKGDWPWQESERYWIRYFRQQGYNLTNNTSGGDGVPDLPPETRERLSKLWVGKKHKEESIIKIGNASRGRKHSEEHKQHMKKLMTGRSITWGDKLSSANRKLSEEDVMSIKNRLDGGAKVKDIALEFNMHRTSISKIKKGTYHDKFRNKSGT